jgi:hypothetical protein
MNRIIPIRCITGFQFSFFSVSHCIAKSQLFVSHSILLQRALSLAPSKSSRAPYQPCSPLAGGIEECIRRICLRASFSGLAEVPSLFRLTERHTELESCSQQA